MHSQLNHDNVVKLHEYTESDDQFVLFMDYCNDASYFDNKIVEVRTIGSERPQRKQTYLGLVMRSHQYEL